MGPNPHYFQTIELLFNAPRLAMNEAAFDACKHDRLRIREGVEQAEVAVVVS